DPHNPDSRHAGDERIAAHEIGAAFAAPGIPAALRESLSERLDRAFLTSEAGLRGRAREALREHTLEMLLRVKAQGGCHAAAQLGEPSRRGRLAVHRLSAGGATRGGWSAVVAVGLSAAVLLAISLSNRPRYNWDSMVEAIRSQPVVNVTQLAKDAPQRSRIVTQKTDASFEAPLTASSLHVTQALGGVLEGLQQEPHDLSSVRDSRFGPDAVSRQLLSLLAQGSPVEATSDLKTRILHYERPQIVERGVLLRVHFLVSEKTLCAEFLLDPQSDLPLSCEILDDLGQSVRSCAFEYQQVR
ncbi:MAG: hypothetical protein KDA37_13795, partial [Planctomycetales bacterium]|nr:hypothetical protein [Planctomycetales bacterium]